MTLPDICFIGAGNMARSIIGGLLAQEGSSAAERITACDPNLDTLQQMEVDFSIHTSTDNGPAVAQADVVVLAVKPQVMADVCQDLAPHLRPGTLVISIAAGIDCTSLEKWLGGDTALVRCMPNTPALVGKGASGLYANAVVTEPQKYEAEAILAAVGLTAWVEKESLMDAVTAVSGSGPAYFFLFMEAVIEAGINQGLDPDTAEALTLQTALGAAELARQSPDSVAQLRRKVMSPGGTTERAITHFENRQLRRTVAEAMQACAERARTLTDELGR